MRVLVVGPSWYGGWTELFVESLDKLDIPNEVIYTNKIGVALDNKGGVGYLAKNLIHKISPSFFDVVKKFLKSRAESRLIKIINSTNEGSRAVLFIWTPPNADFLKRIKKLDPNLRLIFWLGEPLSRDASWRETLDLFDHIFVVDKEDWTGPLGASIYRKSSLLPLSSSADIYYPTELTEEELSRFGSDISFVGLYKKGRADALESLRDFDLRIYGHGWGDAESVSPRLSDKLFGPANLEDMNKIFNASKILISSLGVSFSKDLPTATQGVFSIALSGSFQVGQYNPLTEEIFGDSVPLFSSKEELRELIGFYLKRPELRDELSGRAREIALKNTWDQRAQKAVDVIESLTQAI